ncbi:MAG TPA: epoxyqueuosine reductase QueH [bacterium]|nr:MAG: hypothetical protein BWY14_01098 [Parcubacteria group bacterium ADurb.Bin192]HPN14825.1 epoxyqueuosine reductase QueH [bacterium]
MTKPKMLLHVCCGVCSAYVPEKLLPDYEVTVYFENSNLYPKNEFFKRLEAARVMAEKFNLPFITADYEPAKWYAEVRGLSHEPERGVRCVKCIAHRLDKTMSFAQNNDFSWTATTLSVSRRKNADQINALGFELAQKYKINFLGKDWKKENGEKISQNRAREAGIYRQNYCGCVYSLNTEKTTR